MCNKNKHFFNFSWLAILESAKYHSSNNFTTSVWIKYGTPTSSDTCMMNLNVAFGQKFNFATAILFKLPTFKIKKKIIENFHPPGRINHYYTEFLCLPVFTRSLNNFFKLILMSVFIIQVNRSKLHYRRRIHIQHVLFLFLYFFISYI